MKLIFLLLFPILAHAEPVTFEWDEVTHYIDGRVIDDKPKHYHVFIYDIDHVARYKRIVNGTSTTFDRLYIGDYFASVTCHVPRAESEHSNEVAFSIVENPPPTPTPTPTPTPYVTPSPVPTMR